MERPRSMIGSTIPTAPSHKRNVSSIRSISKLQPPAPITSSQTPRTPAATASRDRETIQLFVNNLRLLDLHLLPDWPHITVSTFTGNDARTRIRCAEWALYQVYRLYDLQTAQDKLQPFFPPLEPLQSINLRAALYRCLNEVKKSGLLGRELVLRKTLLDECNGEKFWELCLTFSTAALKKSTLAVKSRLPVAQRIGTAQSLNKRERDSMLPMAVAHKSALSRVVTQSHKRRQSYLHVFTSMKDKEDELVQRKAAVDSAPQIVESLEHAEDLELIEHEVSGKWTTDEAFKDAIVNGDPARAGDHVLLQSTDEFIASLDKDEAELDTRRDSGVLEDIELQARAQGNRVKEWQAMYAKLQPSKRKSMLAARASRDMTMAMGLQFDQHHELGIDDVQPEPMTTKMDPEPLPSYVSRYDEVLTSMRDELRRAQTARREAEAQKAEEARAVEAQAAQTRAEEAMRKPSITLDAVAGAPQLPHARTSSQRSVSPTFPFRPDMARRASSRTYHQPKVISQRQPIPLKSEAFSPLKRTGSVSPASARSSLIMTPVENSDSPAVDGPVRASQNTSHTPVDSGVVIGLGLDIVASPEESNSSPNDDQLFKKPALPEKKSVSFAHRKSLSERTRMSMSLPRAEPDEPESPPRQSPEAETQDGAQTLAARTRQSMSGINIPLPIRASSSYTHSRSSSVVPQILAPKQRVVTRKTSSSFSGTTEGLEILTPLDTKRDITPREKLFEEDAEYNSVFRSRPKIASSPPLTPRRTDEAMLAANNLDD